MTSETMIPNCIVGRVSWRTALPSRNPLSLRATAPTKGQQVQQFVAAKFQHHPQLRVVQIHACQVRLRNAWARYGS